MARSLEKKIVGLLLVILSVFFLIIAIIFIPWISNYIHNAQMNKMNLLAESIVVHIKKDMVNEEVLIVDLLIDMLNSIKTVTRVEVFKKNGEKAFRDLSTIHAVNKRLGENLFGRKERPTEIMLPPDRVSLRKVVSTVGPILKHEPDSEYHTLFYPLLSDKRCERCHGSEKSLLGVVLIKMSTAQDAATIKLIKQKMVAGFLAIMFTLAFLLWLALKKTVTSPLLKINKSVKYVTEKGLENVALDIDSNDEIGELAKSFNKMTNTLKDNYRKLEDAEQFLNAVLENLGDGIMVVDKNFRIRMTNRQMLKILKIKEDEIIGKKCHSLMNENEENCKNCPAIKAFETGQPAFAHHSGITRKDSTMYVDHFAYPIFDSEGNVVQVIEKVVEISDRIKMEGQLRRAEKLAAVGMLASGVAHEVGNPLASISSLAQLIERESKEHSSKERASLMKGYIDRIYNIVRNVLDFSKPDKGDLVDLDVNPIIESTINFVKYDKRFKNIRITTDFSESLPKIRGNKEGLHQVLMNLIFNAADATSNKQNGRIDILTKQNNGFIVIEICDNGKGISMEDKAKIFDPFFTTKKPGEGMGLGLFTSYKIIKSLNGKVEIESEEGKGTTFLLSLPVSSP